MNHLVKRLKKHNKIMNSNYISIDTVDAFGEMVGIGSSVVFTKNNRLRRGWCVDFTGTNIKVLPSYSVYGAIWIPRDKVTSDFYQHMPEDQFDRFFKETSIGLSYGTYYFIKRVPGYVEWLKEKKGIELQQMSSK